MALLPCEGTWDGYEGLRMDERVAKLPKWVRGIIQKLTRERDVAVKALNNFCDNQTKSEFYYEDCLSTGETRGPTLKKRYVQTYKIQVENAGVFLEIGVKDESIELKWANRKSGLGDVAFIPDSYQSAKLVAKEKMRA